MRRRSTPWRRTSTISTTPISRPSCTLTAVGVVLLRRRAGREGFNGAAACDHAVRALGATVRFAVGAARATIGFTDGGTLAEEVTTSHAGLARPMPDSDIEHKIGELCRHGQSGI